jgi:OPA family glycerol-3-phosphate transporter-like MFS transporter
LENTANPRPATDLKRWQRRTFALIWITYFAYYLCRYNMPVAETRMCEEYGWSAYDFGWVLSALTFMYALGQFVNGQLADRFGTRLIASLGVFGSVVMNVAVYGLVLGGSAVFEDSRSILLCLILFWGANGFFQAMGWAPMVRMMAHWYPAERRGKVMGFLGTCYQFGAAFSSLLAIFLTGYYVGRYD